MNSTGQALKTKVYLFLWSKTCKQIIDVFGINNKTKKQELEIVLISTSH